jgi:hypothetical protein
MMAILGASVAIGLAAALLAVLGGERWRALPGLLGCVAIVSVAAIAYVAGSADDRNRAAARARLQQQGASAATEYPGWYGVASGGVRLFAVQLDPKSELARRVTDNFARPIALLVVGVDNRGGPRDVALDLTEVRLTLRDGSTRASPPYSAILASARSDELRAQLSGRYVIPAGTAKQNNLAFLSPDETMRDVVGVTVELDGGSVTIPGRYYTAEEKRARGAR